MSVSAVGRKAECSADDCVLIDRYVMSVRRTCPYPYADDDDEVSLACEDGPWSEVVSGLFLRASVSDLTPYMRYECLVDAVNEEGGLEAPPSVVATTLPAREWTTELGLYQCYV